VSAKGSAKDMFLGIEMTDLRTVAGIL
jgi:hypothetical protein